MDRTPGAQCTICNHPQRVEIEKAVMAGKSYRAIAGQYGVSREAVGRHKRNGHIAEQIVKAAKEMEIKQAEEIQAAAFAHEAQEVADAKTLKDYVTELKTRAIAILDRAEKEGTREACLALGEVRRTLEFLAKVTGELPDGKPQVNVTVNLLQSPEFQQVLVILDEEIPGEHRERIARRLYALGT